MLYVRYLVNDVMKGQNTFGFAISVVLKSSNLLQELEDSIAIFIGYIGSHFARVS